MTTNWEAKLEGIVYSIDNGNGVDYRVVPLIEALALIQDARVEAIEECAQLIGFQSVSPHWPDLLRTLKNK